MARGPVVNITFTGDARDAQKAAKDTTEALDGVGHSSGLTAGGLASMVAGTAAATEAFGFLKDSVGAAAEDDSQQRIFEQTVRNAGANDEMVTSLNRAQGAAMAKAFTDTEARDALSQLFDQSHDATQAQDDLSTAMDIARRAGVPLATAVDAVSKAHAGQATALGRILPQYKDLVAGSADSEAALNAVKGAVDGQAEAWANTSEGSMAQAKIQFGELQESIGSHVLPVLAVFLDFIVGTLVPGIGRLTGFIDENKTYFIAAAVAVAAVLIPAFIAWAVAAGAAALATIAAAAPVIALGVAAAALALGIVYLWQHFETFRDIVTGVFEGVRVAAETVFSWISDHWPLLFLVLTGGIGPAIAWVVTHLDDISHGFEHIFDVADWLTKNVVGFFQWMGDTVWGIVSPIVGLFDSIISKVQWLLDKIPSIHLPSIPGGGFLGSVGSGLGGLFHADGGIATRAQIGVIGEAGPEAIIPLDRLPALLGQAGGRGGGSVTNVYNIATLDPATAARLVRDAQDQGRRRGFRQPA